MYPLVSGGGCIERFKILASLSSIRSDTQLSALKWYYVNGASEQMACSLAGAAQNNFTRTLHVLNDINYLVEKIKEGDSIMNDDVKLSPGSQTNERFSKLLKLCKISSIPTINALRMHLVDGYEKSYCVSVSDVTNSNFNRAMKTLVKNNQLVEEIKRLDWYKFRNR